MRESTAKNDPPLLALTDVSVSVNGNKLFENVSFDLRPGTFTLLQGSNGVGKTTLLRAMAGVHRSFRGTIAPLSSSIRIALVSSACSFMYEDLSLRENLAIITDSLSSSSSISIDNDLLSHALVAQPLNTLSSGERSIAAFLRALAVNPDVILLDEITSPLDEARRGAVLARTRMLVSKGCAALLVSHDTLDNEKFDARLTLQRSGTKEGFASV